MTKEKLREEWSYEFEAWENEMGSLPVELIKSFDRSESYEMSKATVFKLENGKYALAVEEGCSCYESRDADIEVFPTKLGALASLERWRKGR